MAPGRLTGQDKLRPALSMGSRTGRSMFFNVELRAAQREAGRNARGMWSGNYAVPWRYRARVAAGERPTACSHEAK